MSWGGLLSHLRRVGFLTPLDFHFARTLARMSPTEEPLVSLASGLLSRHVGQGHVCLDLTAFCQHPPRVVEASPDGSESVLAIDWPECSVWVRALSASPLVGDAAASTPLVLDPQLRLYLRRYFEHERALCDDIEARVILPSIESPPRASFDRLFQSPARRADDNAQLGFDVQPEDRQRRAAEVAARTGFCVITGGPGTGKTSTVARILALLVERDLRAGAGAPRIHLLAPTGKAAARLSESIASARASLACDEDVRAAIPSDATTIHRALGARPGHAVGFQHDAEHPLATDLVLVDEASMVDLALMRRLLAAIPHSAQLILLGDRDQLASVEAGAVLGDVCGSGLSRDRRQELPLAGCQVHLTRSYRYAEDSGIGRLSDAIRRRDVPAALAVLASRRYADVSLSPPPTADGPSETLIAEALTAYAALTRVREPAKGFARLSGFRVLCANRHGPLGVERVNLQIAEALRAQRASRRPAGDDAAQRGRPIIIEHNDYQLRVFNGDVGLLLPDALGRLRAVFQDGSGDFRYLSPLRLPVHSSVYAMSIHKSQGSEMDRVAVVLPRPGSPLLTRELLYTAVTRARKRVTLYAEPEAVAAAIETSLRRESGLRARLWHLD